MSDATSGPTSAREAVLARVRAALAEATPADPPARAYGHGAAVADVPALFAERVADYRATVVRVAPSGVAVAVAEAIEGADSVVVPDGLPEEWLPAGLQVVHDESLDATALDRVAAVVTGSTVGIAVTGTIVLDHGPGQGRRALSLVPDLHVCVVREADLVADVPEAVSRLVGSVTAGRPLTWISGPSATSDIELERVEGVHGPRTLHVVLVGG
ncbi:L-lactate dehydrogenase complex protein LldG [Nocardioides terrae]|uniref:L-lactate dehydrogenase complex protein LldG n=1 Tax=Nocardioides terrae TaxID=574651 RepID=A0A1I1N2Y4_9ACTN|nr:lactate utilization protein C [Nocardioides terrae]SFC92011.1 L-lactate dehydrogenase complex protein LldG [Nocardioides terrae]